MWIINLSQFIKELRFPNATSVKDVSGGTDNYEMWIDKEARLCMKNALGFTQYKDLDSNIDVNGDLIDTAPEKWKDLVNGAEYTFQGVDYSWQGLLINEGTYKGSLLAFYVFAKWAKNYGQRMTGVGASSGSAANAKTVNVSQQSIWAWNNFVKMYQLDKCLDLYDYGTVYAHFYRNYPDSDNTNFVSLLTYLVHNEDQYPDAGLKREKFRNMFSI